MLKTSDMAAVVAEVDSDVFAVRASEAARVDQHGRALKRVEWDLVPCRWHSHAGCGTAAGWQAGAGDRLPDGTTTAGRYMCAQCIRDVWSHRHARSGTAYGAIELIDPRRGTHLQTGPCNRPGDLELGQELDMTLAEIDFLAWMSVPEPDDVDVGDAWSYGPDTSVSQSLIAKGRLEQDDIGGIRLSRTGREAWDTLRAHRRKVVTELLCDTAPVDRNPGTEIIGDRLDGVSWQEITQALQCTESDAFDYYIEVA